MGKPAKQLVRVTETARNPYGFFKSHKRHEKRRQAGESDLRRRRQEAAAQRGADERELVASLAEERERERRRRGLRGSILMSEPSSGVTGAKVLGG